MKYKFAHFNFKYLPLKSKSAIQMFTKRSKRNCHPCTVQSKIYDQMSRDFFNLHFYSWSVLRDALVSQVISASCGRALLAANERAMVRAKDWGLNQIIGLVFRTVIQGHHHPNLIKQLFETKTLKSDSNPKVSNHINIIKRGFLSPPKANL